MNRKKKPQKPRAKTTTSNIKSRPLEADLHLPHKKDKVANRVSPYYFLSWVMVAAISVGTVGGLVFNEGGVENAIRTANFKKLNRQIAENRFSAGGDNLPTASINGTGLAPGGVVPSVPLPAFRPDIISKEAANSSMIEEKVYHSVFLGQGNSPSTVLDLWYSIKNQNVELFSGHEASYYYDDVDGVYKLVVGKFDGLSLSLQFCAKLKFNEIACKYDDEYANLQTTSID